MGYLVIYEKSAKGYGAWVPDLPGCVAVGPTRRVVEKRIRGAIAMHLEGMREDGDPIPEPTMWAAVVEVA